MEIKSLENGYFIDKESIRNQLGIEPFLHILREFVSIGDIEDYANSFNALPENLLYLTIDLQRILTLFVSLTNIFIDDYIKVWNNNSLDDALNKFFALSRYLPIDKYSSVYDYLPGDVQRRIAWLIENLIYPHSLLMDKIDKNQVGYAQYAELYKKIKNDVKDAFANAPASLENFEQILISAQYVINLAGELAILGIKLNPSMIGESVAEIIPDLEKNTLETAKLIGDKAGEAAKWAGDKAGEAISSIGKLLSSFLWTAGAAVSIFYLARLSIDHIFTKKNPPDDLFVYAQSLKRDITKSDFNKAISLFRAQHGKLPEKRDIKIVRQPPGVHVPIVVEVGKVPSITYDPPSGRKSPYKYKHDMYDTKLVSDISGNSLFLIGRTYLDTSDGWLKK